MWLLQLFSCVDTQSFFLFSDLYPCLLFLLSAYNIPSQANAALCTSLLLVLVLIPYEGLAEAPSHAFETL